MNQKKVNSVRKKTQRAFWVIVVILTCVISFVVPASAQSQFVRVKTFDTQLQPYPNVEISVNGGDFIDMGDKGIAFAEFDQHQIPVRNIVVNDETLEPESWNYSEGSLEIIIRKKNYKIVSVIVKDQDQLAIPDLPVIVEGKEKLALTTNEEGLIQFPLSLDKEITSSDQFKIEGYNIINSSLNGQNNVLFVQKEKEKEISEKTGENDDLPLAKSDNDEPGAGNYYFKDFNLSKLDSIQSLTVFYAIFKNVNMEELSDEVRQRIDGKFNDLVGELQDSIRYSNLSLIQRISDSTFVRDDIQNLLSQARLEQRMLAIQENEFEDNILKIKNKLENGFASLNEEERAGLLSDLNLLEILLTENESKFYKNQNNYRQIINSLKERFFNLEELENKLSASEMLRLEEQRVFRQRLLTVASIAIVLALLILLLIYFSNKLKKQKTELEKANNEIRRINENLEAIVAERTKLLTETNKELDTVLYRASHDLRSPVRSIIGLCNIATSLSNGESHEIIEKVVRTTSDMDSLLKKLSVISEINQPTNFSTVDLRKMVGTIQKDFEEIITYNNVNFIVNCPDDIAFDSFPDLIEIILSNLLENAFFYCILKNSKGSKVEFSATINNDQLEFILVDNGVGIEDAVVPKLFDMFFRGDEHSKGHGLGLYIVHKAVQALEGKISVESKIGTYAKFVVQLPVKKNQILSAPVAESAIYKSL